MACLGTNSTQIDYWDATKKRVANDFRDELGSSSRPSRSVVEVQVIVICLWYC